jgi:hypothetical protein
VGTAGQPFTVSICAWTDQGSKPFYFYLSQWTGVDGRDGRHGTGNTIFDTGAGVDHNSYNQEIMNRSGQLTMTSVPSCFEHTFEELDNLVGSTVAAGDSIIYGIGFDWQEIEIGDAVNLTLLRGEVGRHLPNWRRPPDAYAFAMAPHYYRRFGRGLTGTAINEHTIRLPLSLSGIRDPKADNGTISLLGDDPVFLRPSGHAVSVSSAKIVAQSIGQNGGYVIIGGFEGMSTGESVMFSGRFATGASNSDLLALAYSMDWPSTGTRWQP